MSSRPELRKSTDRAVMRPPAKAFREQNLALTRLAKSRSLAVADTGSFLREVTRTVAKTLDVERASVWLYVGDRRAIRCADLYQRQSRTHSEGLELSAVDYPRYFASLERRRAIAADDARTDPATAEFTDSYLVPFGITSMLDAPIRGGDGMLGVICLEHVGPARQWRTEEQNFAASVADLVALGFESAERRRAAEQFRRSERLYRTLAENFPNGAVLLYDKDLRYMVAGGAGLSEVGLSSEVLEGRTIWEVFPQETCAAIETHYRAALEGEERVFEVEFADRRYEVHAVPVRDEAGRVTAGMVMTQNVTDRRRVENEIRQNAKVLADAQSIARLGVFEWRADQNKVTWSNELFRIYGLEPGEFAATFEAFLSRVHPDDRETVRGNVERAYRDGSAFEQEERIVRPDGSIRVLATKGGPMVNDRGETIGILGICQDVTAIKEAQRLQEAYSRTLEEQVAERTRELREKQAQLLQSAKLASLGGLAAGLAHEINSPLGAMLGSNDVVRRTAARIKDLLSTGGEVSHTANALGDLAERIEEAEQLNRIAGERISSILSSLKQFAQVDQAREDWVDIHEGIDSTLALVTHLTVDRIELRREYSPLPPIRCFPNRLNQVYMNLLLNAIQAIPARGTVTIRTFAEDRHAVIEISDTGVGIPKAHLDRIFDPGFTTKGVKVGVGLGLAIVHRTVEEHGGSIGVESEPGAGTTFRIKLPLAR